MYIISIRLLNLITFYLIIFPFYIGPILVYYYYHSSCITVFVLVFVLVFVSQYLYMNVFLQQLAALLITRQVIGNVKEALIPFIIEKVKLFKISYKMASALSPSVMDAKMEKMKENGAPKIDGVDETTTDENKDEIQDETKLQTNFTTPTLTQAEVEAAQKAVSPQKVTHYYLLEEPAIELCIEYRGKEYRGK